MRQRLQLIVLGVSFLAACFNATGPAADGYEDCSAGGLLSFAVDVTDFATSQPLPSTPTLRWTAGQSSGSSMPQVPPTTPSITAVVVGGPYGRPGAFTISITAPGYRDWSIAGISVLEGASHCSVRETVRLIAKLQRQ